MKTTSLYNYTSNQNGASFDLADGSDIRIDWDDLTDDIKRQLMAHGLKQKVADAAAIPRDTETGRSATNAEKIAAMQAVAARLVNGEWNAVKGDGSGATGGILLRALVELYPAKSREDLVAYVAKLDKKQQAALRANAKVAPVIERLRAAKASDVDTDAMLDELAD
jgi:hypothetical protein